MVNRERGVIKTRLIRGYITGHVSSILSALDLEWTHLKPLPPSKAASDISPLAVIGNIDCTVYSHLLSPYTDTETNSLGDRSITKASLSTTGARTNSAATRNE